LNFRRESILAWVQAPSENQAMTTRNNAVLSHHGEFPCGWFVEHVNCHQWRMVWAVSIRYLVTMAKLHISILINPS